MALIKVYRRGKEDSSANLAEVNKSRKVCGRLVRGRIAAVKNSSMMSAHMGATVGVPMEVESLSTQKNLR